MVKSPIVSPPFVTGANLPWVHYGIDFGANAWCPDGGLGRTSSPAGLEDSSQLDVEFERLAAASIDVLRWFLFCDGRAGIQFSAGGHPQGIDAFVFRDIDVALAAAQRHGLRIMFVMLDFHWCKPARIVKGVQLGGRSHLLQDHAACDALAETVFRPVLERYGREPSIFAWDIINEPEWIGTLTREEVHAFLTATVSLVRSCTTQQITVGSAGARWRGFYSGLNLDFYQVHWYDSLRHQPPLETPVTDLGFDKPVILGEFPTRGSKRSSSEIVETVRDAGYAGAFYWSVLAKDQYSA
jgi:hypothetical protein